jgi:hypothetical protein
VRPAVACAAPITIVARFGATVAIVRKADEMTEDQIERKVERRFDALDARLMGGGMTQAEYDAAALAIRELAEVEYRSAFTRKWEPLT